jgi:hypothetical protein
MCRPGGKWRQRLPEVNEMDCTVKAAGQNCVGVQRRAAKYLEEHYKRAVLL